MSAHTPGPWPIEWTGDHKRILIGKGLVEGPDGYEVAEVYADDCPREVAEANARLIAVAPDLLFHLKNTVLLAKAALLMTTAELAKDAMGLIRETEAVIAKAEGRT